ncbi:hypothetical protein ABPG73_012402 [Tetrahymena malaccensis]
MMLVFVKSQDQIPIQVSSNVYFIQENNAIIYKQFNDKTWRYSKLDQNGNITSTYKIENFSDLNNLTYYFIINNNQIWFSGFGLDYNQIIDINQLQTNQKNYLNKKKFFNPNFNWQASSIIRKYGEIYYYICLNGKYLKEQNFEDLFTTKQSYYFEGIVVARQTYLLIQGFLLIYKNTVFDNKSVAELNPFYLLVDEKYDIFLKDNQLCKSSFDQQYYSFSCSKSYYLGVSIDDPYSRVVLSKVFQSNGMDIIFGYNFEKRRYIFFDANQLNIIDTTGDSIINPLSNKDIIQIDNQIFIQRNKYIATYSSSTQKIEIKLITSNLQSNYYTLPNAPFYNYNFRSGNIIYLQQEDNQYILNINSIYCPQFCNQCEDFSKCKVCNPGYFLDNFFSCQKCQDPDFVFNSQNKKCECKSNMIQQGNSCVCKEGFSRDSNNNCQQCPSNCIQCDNLKKCLKCSPQYLKNNISECQKCPTSDYQLDSQNKCICKPNMIEKNGACICDEGFIRDSLNICQQQKCPLNCVLCDKNNQCTQCNPGYQLSQQNSQCIQCPSSDFQLDSQNNCICKENMSLSSKVCVCNQGYSRNSLNICQQCPQNCNQCDPQQKCTACQSGYFLDNTSQCQLCPLTQNILLPDGKCQFCDTKNGFYLSNNQCIPCQQTNCLECIDQKQCTKYADCKGQLIYNSTSKQCEQCLWDIQKKQCVESCDLTYQHHNLTNKTCSQCFYLNQKCEQSCPKGYYYDSNYICQKCHSSCKTCKGPKQNQCTSCFQTYFLQDDQKCSQCEDRYFFDESSKQCKKCSISCFTCNGASSNNCLSCTEGLKLSDQTNECLSQSEIDNQSQLTQKFLYSNCDQTSYDCYILSSSSDLVQKINLGLFVTFLITFILSNFLSSSSNMIGWYGIQILQLIGNLAFNQNMNVFWLNIGFLKGFLSYNIFNLITLNQFQKQEDLMIDFNQFQIGIQIQNLYRNFIQNGFYQLIGLVVVIFTLLLSCLLKGQMSILNRLFQYMFISGVIRYFMVASNLILVYSLNIIQQSNYESSGNIYFVGIFGFIYFLIQSVCFYGLTFNNQANFLNKIQAVYKGLIQYKVLQKLFWTFFELRKILCISCMIFFNSFEYCGIIMASSSLFFLIFLLISQPIEQKTDLKAIQIIEFIFIILFVKFSLITNRAKWNISNQMATYLSISFIVLSLVITILLISFFTINIYQSIKSYFINRRHERIIQKNAQPILQQFQLFHSMKDIESTLSQAINNFKFSHKKFPKKDF